MAYNEAFLQDYIKKCGINFRIKKFADIGIAYFISTRERER